MSATAAWTRDHSWFLRALSEAESRVLVIDYDGTVASFSRDRSRARPYPGVPPLLQTIMDTCATRLVIISGRGARDIPRLLGIHPMPEIWGSHGVERLYPDGRYEESNVNDSALQKLGEAELKLEEQCLGPHLEVKLAAVAVHWRGLAPSEVLSVRSKASRIMEPMTSGSDLVLAEFDEGLELRMRSANKGEAVKRLLEQLDTHTPIAYLGDDVDDEDAFRVLNDRGLTVLVRSKKRFTAAQMIVRPPDGLIDFLTEWIRMCAKKR